VGVLVFSIKANEAIYAANERDPFLMASNTKLLTTAAALGRLGPDFRFRTLVGTVDRDLHVFAGGDPNISGRFHDDDPTAIFKKWAERIRAAGVARIEDLVLHTGIFDADRVNPGWKKYEAGPWWSAPFAALSLNDNCVDLKVEPGPEGEPCKVTLAPDTAYVTLVNRTQTVAKPAQPLRISRPEGANVITLRGEVGLKDKPSTHWVSVHEPVMYFGTVLRETLAKAGIEVAGGIEESPRPREEQKDFRELASWESDLAATIAVCNGPSQNFYAEMILRTLGWKGIPAAGGEAREDRAGGRFRAYARERGLPGRPRETPALHADAHARARVPRVAPRQRRAQGNPPEPDDRGGRAGTRPRQDGAHRRRFVPLRLRRVARRGHLRLFDPGERRPLRADPRRRPSPGPVVRTAGAIQGRLAPPSTPC
jgi:PBP4 family serine-type D-alanyl-D-alanine carboxypeptidase